MVTRILNLAWKDAGKLRVHYCGDFRKVYEVDRSEIVWTWATIFAPFSALRKSPSVEMACEIVCPCCSGRKPILRDLDVLMIDLIERGPSESAQSVLEALYLARGRPVRAEHIFDRIYDQDPDGGPSQAKMYADLRNALAELSVKLDGTGLGLIRMSRQDGWRLLMDRGGAFVAV